jgi:hypothetical protein
MKTTMLFRPIANPRRTRLAALQDAQPQRQAEQDMQEMRDMQDVQDMRVARADRAERAAQGAEPDGTPARPMPQQTANPRRTVLTELPTGSTPAE